MVERDGLSVGGGAGEPGRKRDLGDGALSGRDWVGRRGLVSGRGREGRDCQSRLPPESVSLGATCGAMRQGEATRGRLRLNDTWGGSHLRPEGRGSGERLVPLRKSQRPEAVR